MNFICCKCGQLVSKENVVIISKSALCADCYELLKDLVPITCPVCNGNGKIKDPRGSKLCPVCKGTGLK